MIDRSETRDVPNDPLTVIGRGGVGNSHRGNHLGPRPWSRSDRGRTYDCKRSDQSNLQRSCRLGAVHIWVMERRRFTREFKLEAVRLIRGRGASYAQASQDLIVHPTQLRSWVKAFADDPQQGVPGPRSDEARAIGDRAAQARGAQAEGRARHPKKSRGLLREGIDVKFGSLRSTGGFGRRNGCARRSVCS